MDRTVRLRGRLRWTDLEGGVYILRAEDGNSYDLHGVERFISPEDIGEGVEVEIEGVLLADALDFHMVGPIIRVEGLVAQRRRPEG